MCSLAAKLQLVFNLRVNSKVKSEEQKVAHAVRKLRGLSE
jgi:hypothetical protein